MAKKPALKTIRASEIALAESARAELGRSLAPIEAWVAVDNPEVYLESRLPKYLAGLEHLLEVVVKENDIDRARGILNDLIRLTKMGRAKADVNIVGPTKLRNENDLSKLSTEALRKALEEASL